MSLPRRNITPRSYSLRILIAAEAKINRKIIKNRMPGENPVMSILFPLDLFSIILFQKSKYKPLHVKGHKNALTEGGEYIQPLPKIFVFNLMIKINWIEHFLPGQA